jgi:hypothetical protein
MKTARTAQQNIVKLYKVKWRPTVYVRQRWMLPKDVFGNNVREMMGFYFRIRHGTRYFLHWGSIMVRIVSIHVWYCPQYDCLIHSIDRDLQKLTLTELINKFPAPYRTQRLIIKFTWKSKIYYYIYMELKDSLSCLHEIKSFNIMFTLN